jgi:hypothetical protein
MQVVTMISIVEGMHPGQWAVTLVVVVKILGLLWTLPLSQPVADEDVVADKEEDGVKGTDQ